MYIISMLCSNICVYFIVIILYIIIHLIMKLSYCDVAEFHILNSFHIYIVLTYIFVGRMN